MGIFSAKIGITNDDILAHIKDVLREASAGEKVYLISPYWKLNTNFRDSISETVARGVLLRCLIREGMALNTEDRSFVETARLDLRSLDHLHAKVYWSPSFAVVTSMNLHNYSDKETREIAIIIDDKSSLKELESIADSWWEKAFRPTAIRQAQSPRTSSSSARKKREKASQCGHCIRCGKTKTYNPEYPLCDKCYPIWAKYKDKDYTEKACHGCGEAIQSSVAKPLCRKCYKLNPFDK